MPSKRIFSAVQPTGHAHLGNLFGALLPWVRLQEIAAHSCYFAIADLHALTTRARYPSVGDLSRQMLAQLLAIGLCPERSVLFRQSSVAAHSQLHWILSNFAPVSHLQRMTQYKSKTTSSAEPPTLGLFSYPVLQAADILLYDTDYVPVGDDQEQHLELARSIASSFNHAVGSAVLRIPETLTGDIPRVMSLRDGRKKMSKSDPSPMAFIAITDSNDAIQAKIRRCKTDSLGPVSFDDERRPEISNLVRLYAQLSGLDVGAVCEQFQQATLSGFKAALTDRVVAFLAPIRARYDRFSAMPDELDRLLAVGAQRAGQVAEATLDRVQRAIRLTPSDGPAAAAAATVSAVPERQAGAAAGSPVGPDGYC